MSILVRAAERHFDVAMPPAHDVAGFVVGMSFALAAFVVAAL